MKNGEILVRPLAAAVWIAIVLMPACGGSGASPASTPLSPSAVASSAAAFDGYDDPYGPPPAPPEPPPFGPVAPVPDQPMPAVPPVVINIVGFFGTGAFAPNPIQAVMGDTIVWTNGDRNPHRIVLDDGTVIGSIAPGESTPPITLTTPAAGFHCTIHPSMVGIIATPDAPPGFPPMAPPPDDDDDDDYYDDY